MRRARLSRFAVAALGLLVLASCGEEPRDIACDEGTTVTEADNGRRVEVEECDRLFLRLGRPSAGSAWILTGSPDEILRLEDEDPVAGDFHFLATAPGQGRIVLVARDCPPPLPGSEWGEDMPEGICPVGGAPGDQTPPDPGRRPPLPDAFILTVVVVEG